MKPGLLLSVFMAALLLLVVLGKPYTCQFGHLYSKTNHYQSSVPKAHQVLRGHQSKRLLVGGMQQMRITLNTDDFDTVKPAGTGLSVTTLTNLAFVKKSMQVAAAFFSSRLKVTPENGNLDVPTFCTADYQTPASDVSTGIANSDLHIYTLYSTSSVGYGATGVSCNHVTTAGVSYPDTTLTAGRPIIGRIIFNTHNLVDGETLTNRLFASVTATALHETLHILGFSQALFGTFMDTDGNLHTDMTEQVSLHGSRGDNYLLKTPNVVAWTQDHFDCAGLTGFPLENEDGGTMGSHWERLNAYDELMTGTSLGAQKSFTALTFAMIKDMGWYEVDDTFNDTTNYGYKDGCDFFNDACYGTTTYTKYFCDTVAYTGISECSTTYTGKAICDAQTGLMADGCALFAEYLYCVDENAPRNGYVVRTYEQFGISSFCVKGTLGETGVPSAERGRCYPHVCDYDTESIVFTVGVYELYCLSVDQGTHKTIPEIQGYIECPMFEDFCTDSRRFCPNWCSQNGFCTRGICNCYADETVIYSGEDCSISACASLSDFYDPQTGLCSPSCNTGYYANPSSRTCLPCDSTCGNCRDEPQICTTCLSTPENPQYFDTVGLNCVSECPDGTFLEVDDQCYPCDTTPAYCATCSGSAANCLSCQPTYYLTGSSCSLTCSGSYPISDVVNMNCVATSTSCPGYLVFDSNSNTCDYCSTGFKQIDTTGTCIASCLDGYWQDDGRRVCDLCDSSCRTCYDQFAENCTECKSTGTLNYWYQDMCVATCPGGYYANANSNQCELCVVSLHCYTCSYDGTTVTCLTCKYGYYMDSTTSVCGLACDVDEYQNKWNQSCDPCHLDCSSCTGPENTQCISCPGTFYLSNQTGGYCLSDCPSEGYVRTSICQACHESCLTCDGLTSSHCTNCHDGYYLQSQKCRLVCSPGKYPDADTDTCVDCDQDCSFCFGGTVDNCTQCVPNKVLNNFTCTDACPSGQSANSYSVCELNNWERSLSFLGMLLLIVLI